MTPEVVRCARCADIAQLLHGPSDISYLVDYYRCPTCADVWAQPKPGRAGTRRLVTVSSSDSPDPPH